MLSEVIKTEVSSVPTYFPQIFPNFISFPTRNECSCTEIYTWLSEICLKVKTYAAAVK